jgi:hypothetical protein
MSYIVSFALAQSEWLVKTITQELTSKTTELNEANTALAKSNETLELKTTELNIQAGFYLSQTMKIFLFIF